MPKIVRLHDSLYLKEKRYEKTKQSFKYLIKILKEQKIFQTSKILDIGCANGELLYNLRKHFNHSQLTGYDVNKSLLKLCKKKFKKDISFKKVNINSKISINDKFDIIIVSGVISIFDDCKLVYKNLLKLLNKNGKIFIFNHFNKFPIEVFIKYKTYDKNSKYLQSGWNIHSIAGIRNFYKKHSYKLKTHKFIPMKPIKKYRQDPVRSWTFKNKKGENLITNGLSIIQDQYWLEIYK